MQTPCTPASTYSGEDITVTDSVRRCIHAEACVHGLPGVFDPNRRPWIDPDQAAVGQLLNHPLTDIGLEKVLADWQTFQASLKDEVRA